MSNEIIIKIEKAEKTLKNIFDDAPFLLKKNTMFSGVTGISEQLIEILKDQQNTIDLLRDELSMQDCQIADLQNDKLKK